MQIRILPTLVYLLFLYLINLARGAVGGLFIYAYVLLLILPIVSIMHIIITGITLRYMQDFSTHHANRGDFVPYRLKISNEMPFFSPGINVRFRVINPQIHRLQQEEPGEKAKGLKDFTLSLKPRERYEYRTDVHCPLIGIYSIGLESLVISDMLDWIHIKPRVMFFTLYVYPRILSVPRLTGYSRTSGNSTGSRHGSHRDLSYFAGLREYRPGESISMIHWRRFSAQGVAMIREYTPVSLLSFTLYLDTRRSEDEDMDIIRREDFSLELLVSCCAALLEDGVPVDVRIPGTEPLSLKTPDDLSLLQQKSLEARFHSNADMLSLFHRDSAEGMNQGKSILFITHQVGGELLTLLKSGAGIQSSLEAVVNETAADESLRAHNRKRIHQLASGTGLIHFTDADAGSGSAIPWI